MLMLLSGMYDSPHPQNSAFSSSENNDQFAVETPYIAQKNNILQERQVNSSLFSLRVQQIHRDHSYVDLILPLAP